MTTEDGVLLREKVHTHTLLALFVGEVTQNCRQSENPTLTQQLQSLPLSFPPFVLHSLLHSHTHTYTPHTNASTNTHTHTHTHTRLCMDMCAGVYYTRQLG